MQQEFTSIRKKSELKLSQISPDLTSEKDEILDLFAIPRVKSGCYIAFVALLFVFPAL